MSEDWLRRRLEDLSEDPPARPERVTGVLTRARRRQRVRTGLLAGAMAGAVVVAATAVTGGGWTQSLVADRPDPSASTTASPGAGPTPSPSAGGPDPGPTAPTTTEGHRSSAPAVAPSAGGPRDTAPLRVGFVGALSSPATAPSPPLGERAHRVLRAWAADVNARGGLDGRPVELLVRDDGGDERRRRSAVDALVREGVAAFVGSHLGGSGGDPSAQLLREAGVPLVGGDLASADWRSNPVLFAQGTLPEELGEGTLAVLGEQTEGDGRDAAVVCVDSALCRDLEERVVEAERAEAYGLRGTTVERIGVTETNYAPTVQRLRSRGVERVALQMAHHQAAALGREFERQDYRPASVVVHLTDGELTEELAEQRASAGWWAVSPVFPHIASQGPAARFQRVTAGGTAGAPEARAWAAAVLLERAVQQLGGGSATPSALLAALRGLAGERLGGLVPVLDPGARPATRCLMTARVRDGAWAATEGLSQRCLAS